MLVAKLAIACYFAGLLSAVAGDSGGANTTCESLNNLAMKAQSLSHLGYSEVCNTTDSCLGIQCTAQVSQGSQTYSKFVLLPCQHPRAIHIISVYNDQVLLNDVINESKVFDYTVPGTPFVLEINVTFEDRKDSVLLGSEAIFYSTKYPLLPVTVIPIDDDLCNGSMAVTTPAPPPPTLPTSPSQPTTTCEAAQLLASEVPKRLSLPIFDATETCASFYNCSGVHCSAIYQFNNYSSKVYFLPCANPPALRLVIDDNTGKVHIDRIANKNTTIPFNTGGITVDIIVTLIHQTDDSVLFALSAYVALFQLSLDIIPLTTIPMDRSSCPPPDSCDVWDTIADDLDTLAQEHFRGTAHVEDVCNRYGNCSGVACSLNVTVGKTTTYHANLEVLPCLNPPAINLLFTDNSGAKYYDRNFDKSAVDSFSVPATIGFISIPVTLHVTVNQLPGAVAFALAIEAPFVNSVELIPLTEIPVDKSTCSTEAPDKVVQAPAVSVVGISVGVILGVVILALIPAAVGAVIVWWLYRRRKGVHYGPDITFATKDYTDEANVSELDDAAD